MCEELEKVRERNEADRYLGEMHSRGVRSQCKGPGRERA